MSNYDVTLNQKTGRYVVVGRLLWNSLFQPRKGKGGKEGKYECNIAIPAEAKLKLLQDAAVEAGRHGKYGTVAKAFKDAPAGKWPSSVKNPFKKTSENDKLADIAAAFPTYIAARAKDRPGVVGPNGKAEGVEPSHVYPGRWVKVSLDAYDYDTDGNKGVTFGLGNVQLLQDDEELVIGGGRVSAESEFEGVGDTGSDAGGMFE
jgi:hypothetical protein